MVIPARCAMSSKWIAPGCTARAAAGCVDSEDCPAPRLAKFAATIAAGIKNKKRARFMQALWSSERDGAVKDADEGESAAPEYSFLVGQDLLLRFAEALNPQSNHVPGLQVNRRLHAQSHSWRRSRADHVTRKQRHEFAHVAHQIGDAKNHLLGVAFLARRAIHL